MNRNPVINQCKHFSWTLQDYNGKFINNIIEILIPFKLCWEDPQPNLHTRKRILEPSMESEP